MRGQLLTVRGNGAVNFIARFLVVFDLDEQHGAVILQHQQTCSDKQQINEALKYTGNVSTTNRLQQTENEPPINNLI